MTSGVGERSGEPPQTDYAAVFRAMPTPYLVMTPDLVIADANPAYLARTGRRLDELVGRPVFDAFPGNPNETDPDGGATRIRASFERARDTGLIDTMELQEYDIPDGRGGFSQRFWSLISIPVVDGSGACRYVIQRAEDITDYVLDQRGAGDRGEPSHGMEWRRRVLDVESDLFARGLELAASREAELATARRLAALAGVALDLAAADSVEELVQIVSVSGLEALGAHGAAVAVRDGELLRLELTEDLGPVARERYAVLPLDAPLPGAVAARTGRTLVLPDRAATVAFAAEMAEAVQSTGNEAWVALPLQAGSRNLGSLMVGWTRAQAFTAEDIDLLEAFAAQCAQVLDRIQTRQAERAAHAAVRGMAEALQRSLLTEPPQPADLEIAVRYLPAAEQAQVGGDWYDAFMVGDGSTMLVIGDVTGHDRHAAAAMAQVRNVLRGVAHSQPESPARVLAALDRAMGDLAVGTLATAVLARVENGPDGAGCQRLLRWSNAGHPPPVLVEADGTVTLLERTPNRLLGVEAGSLRVEHVWLLPPGATLLLYTDGLVERRGATLDDGMAWLCEEVSRLHALPLDELCDRLLEVLPAELDDDVAILALRARHT
ncbi:SpoIIE family protein phosphatase [Blastococcus haudaquaticus]|uniref:Serine phosphatase RsbU, regulator of sigma subunit n=1 Tax=Blastococcus haudaquaticus TaxID=1938745 RepID=A0A286GJL0_9ACTN|nr:SpoIIE family protein phosphatase [Blastococcus haudaquaticus]SOD95717.1 Serine phosphatase RsbU, regulator of sigma subunit [Blastococcus haudaquaticus]